MASSGVYSGSNQPLARTRPLAGERSAVASSRTGDDRHSKGSGVGDQDRLEEPAYRDLKEALRGKIQMAATYRPADELPDVKRYLELNHKFIEAALETHGGEGQFSFRGTYRVDGKPSAMRSRADMSSPIDYMRGIEDTLDPNNRQMTFFL